VMIKYRYVLSKNNFNPFTELKQLFSEVMKYDRYLIRTRRHIANPCHILPGLKAAYRNGPNFELTYPLNCEIVWPQDLLAKVPSHDAVVTLFARMQNINPTEKPALKKDLKPENKASDLEEEPEKHDLTKEEEVQRQEILEKVEIIDDDHEEQYLRRLKIIDLQRDKMEIEYEDNISDIQQQSFTNLQILSDVAVDIKEENHRLKKLCTAALNMAKEAHDIEVLRSENKVAVHKFNFLLKRMYIC